MKTINCLVNGEMVEMDCALLTPFSESVDNENETILSTGWKLDNVIVQNDIHMTLKKAATFVESTEGSLN